MANEGRGKVMNLIQHNYVAVSIVLVIFLLFIPIPKIIIDLCMILNLAFAIIILLVVVRIPRPSDFQTFPRVILFQTLFSLGINISSTRLILTGQIRNGQLLGQSDMVNAFANIVAVSTTPITCLNLFSEIVLHILLLQDV